MDETAVFLYPKGTLLLAEKGKPLYDITSTSEKENVTTLITVNAEGQMAPPLTMYKYNRLPNAVIEAAPSGWGIEKSENGKKELKCQLLYFWWG
ncbi:hypothetical protein QE152_g29998 [Popillia japonica]|uniref:Uncharacterized protein n=1 Tax=Popillia japonica TaxID=7064 RepID=A0AAW1JFU5_POPJA